ncbi:MAG TPA: secondary thiamine-phosphate synthase enzyme YjbQ [Clostridia bacterium]|nr:secondary thiamine-phosphate synthase enzyme YjbQ [Clostridia bacterium]
MLRQASKELKVSTRGRGLYECTGPIRQWVAAEQFRDGLLTVFVRHTSASLLIQENADPDVQRDLDNFFARLVPDGDPAYIHTIEGEDDMPAHIRSALTAVTLSIPVVRGELALGTWQGIYLWEHRTAPHARSLVLQCIGE